MGNKARRGKTQPRSTGGQETAPSLQRPGGLQRLRSRTAGRGTHTLRAPPAASLSAALCSAKPAGPRTQEAAPLSAPGRLNADAAEHPPAAERARPPPHCGLGLQLQTAPGPGGPPPTSRALTLQCAHPGAGGAGSQCVSPEVAGPGTGAAPWPGERGRSTGGSRPAGAARGRAAAAEQAGKRSSSGAARPRGGGTPCLVLGIWGTHPRSPLQGSSPGICGPTP